MKISQQFLSSVSEGPVLKPRRLSPLKVTSGLHPLYHHLMSLSWKFVHFEPLFSFNVHTRELYFFLL